MLKTHIQNPLKFEGRRRFSTSKVEKCTNLYSKLQIWRPDLMINEHKRNNVMTDLKHKLNLIH